MYSEALQRYTDTEKAYPRACCTDDEQLQYNTESEMNAYCDLMTVAVQPALNDETDNIEYYRYHFPIEFALNSKRVLLRKDVVNLHLLVESAV